MVPHYITDVKKCVVTECFSIKEKIMGQCLAVALSPTIKTSRFVVVTGCTPDTYADTVIGEVLGLFTKTNVLGINILIWLPPKSHASGLHMFSLRKVSPKFCF